MLLAVSSCSAQMLHPLQGQNLPPPGVTAVQVDIILDTIRAINSDSNSWNGVHWVHLSWNDSRAAPAIQTRTEAWTASGADGSFLNNCSMPCDSSGSPTAGCCDGVWLPHVDTNNLITLSQEASYRWRIWVDPVTTVSTSINGTTTNVTTASNRVHWVARLTAEYQSPFDFRAWPFEHQHLLFELQVPAALGDRMYLVMGQAALADHTPHHKGDQVPGWHVVKTSRHIFNSSSSCFGQTAPTAIYSVTEDLSKVSLQPLSPGDWATLKYRAVSDNTTLIDGEEHTCMAFNPEVTAQYGPQILVMDVMVRRTQLYYILAYILPLLLLDYMVFITYAMERSDLESRMGVVVTLVLAVSALQFTYNFPPASYLNAVQQITLMSYVLYFIVAVQSMITSHICRLHSRKRHLDTLVSLSRKRNLDTCPPDVNSRHTVMGTAASVSLDHQASSMSMARHTSYSKELRPQSGVNLGPDGGRRGSYSETGAGVPLPHPGFSQLATLYSNRFGEGEVDEEDNTRSTNNNHVGPRVDGNSAPVSGRNTTDGTRPHLTVSVDLENPFVAAGRMSGLTRSRGGRPVAESSEDECAYPYTSTANDSHEGWTRAEPGPVAEAGEAATGLEETCLTSDCEKGSWRSRGRGFLRCFSSNKQNSRSPSPGGQQRTLSGPPATPMADRNGSSVVVPPCKPGPPQKRMSFDGRTFKRMGSSVARVASQTRMINQKIDADEAFAQLVARRLDQIFSWTLLVCFSTCVAVLLYVNQQVGDHRLMLSGNKPANM